MDARKTDPNMKWASRRRRRIACARQKAPESFRQISQTGAKAVGKRRSCTNSPGVSRPAKLPAMRTAGEAAKPSAPPIFRPADRAQSGRLVWNGYGGKPPRSAARARGKGRIAFVKKKMTPRRRERLACTRLTFSSNGARLVPPPPLISQTKRRPSEWTASEATEFEQLPAQR